jgi:(p)ppGpp synthase/HD superfamily hydrolase
MTLTKEDRRRLARAFKLTLRWHAFQQRKNSEIPYMSHLVQVMGIILEHSGDVDQAIAGLFHDALEDAPGATERKERETIILEKFGEDVMQIVLDCTDTGVDESIGEKAPWRKRKEKYLEHLAKTSDRSLLVAACDKRHNLYSMVWDLRHSGIEYLASFNAEPDQQVWFFEKVLEAIEGRVPERLFSEMETLTGELRDLVAAAH